MTILTRMSAIFYKASRESTSNWLCKTDYWCCNLIYYWFYYWFIINFIIKDGLLPTLQGCHFGPQNINRRPTTKRRTYSNLQQQNHVLHQPTSNQQLSTIDLSLEEKIWITTGNKQEPIEKYKVKTNKTDLLFWLQTVEFSSRERLPLHDRTSFLEVEQSP
jgi:hypothetical protein